MIEEKLKQLDMRSEAKQKENGGGDAQGWRGRDDRPRERSRDAPRDGGRGRSRDAPRDGPRGRSNDGDYSREGPRPRSRDDRGYSDRGYDDRRDNKNGDRHPGDGHSNPSDNRNGDHRNGGPPEDTRSWRDEGVRNEPPRSRLERENNAPTEHNNKDNGVTSPGKGKKYKDKDAPIVLPKYEEPEKPVFSQQSRFAALGLSDEENGGGMSSGDEDATEEEGGIVEQQQQQPQVVETC